MEWIHNLLYNQKRKNQLSSLIAHAYLEKRVNDEEIHLLQLHIPAVSIDNDPDPNGKSTDSLFDLTDKEQFYLIYYLIKSLMRDGGISFQKRVIIGKLLEALDLPTDKAKELTCYITTNIEHGLSRDDSYNRLGYLLDPRFAV